MASFAQVLVPAHWSYILFGQNTSARQYAKRQQNIQSIVDPVGAVGGSPPLNRYIFRRDVVRKSLLPQLWLHFSNTEVEKCPSNSILLGHLLLVMHTVLLRLLGHIAVLLMRPYRRSSVVCRSVTILSPPKNGWIDQDVVWDVDLDWPKEPCIVSYRIVYSFNNQLELT